MRRAATPKAATSKAATSKAGTSKYLRATVTAVCAAGLATSGYTQETAGTAGRGGQRGGAADEVIDAEFKPRS